jgi:hypothetical protein
MSLLSGFPVQPSPDEKTSLLPIITVNGVFDLHCGVTFSQAGHGAILSCRAEKRDKLSLTGVTF